MNLAISVWFVIFCAVVAANLPFINQRYFGVGPLVSGPKRLQTRLIELCIAYNLVGLVGLLLEKRIGQVANQGWEFYVITATLFLTLAFPGFVFQFLLRRPR